VEPLSYTSKGLEYGFLAGGGYDFKRFDLELQYGRTINKAIYNFEFVGLTSRFRLSK
jgi:hypothetical protein